MKTIDEKIPSGYIKLKEGQIITKECLVLLRNEIWKKTYKREIGLKYKPHYKGANWKHCAHIKRI